jgi:hypothetical protein
VLRREPSDTETEVLLAALTHSGNIERALQDMLSSHEFGVMVLPDIINTYFTQTPDHPVFFLHVPKTAGTSFRLALTDTMGIPAFLLYVHTTWQGFGEKSNMDFWPLWAGHAGVPAFPETHRGITVFRESRSRMLSLYRQQQREIARIVTLGSRNTLDNSLNATPGHRVTAADPFNQWIRHSRGTIVWFIDTPRTDGAFLWNGRPTGEYLDSLTPGEVRDSLTRSLTRFDAAAWVHDSDAMDKAISHITQREVTAPIGRENEFTESPDFHITHLSQDDLAQLERIADSDKILFDIAVDHGLISPMDSAFADDEFERTARRLGFTLP